MVTTLRMACCGRTETGARCRENAQEGKRTCSRHEGKPLMDPADIVLLKVRVNRNWAEKLERAGLVYKDRNDAFLDEKHAAHAEKHRRRADAIRDKPDSGTPVFGKEGTKQTMVDQMERELNRSGYQLTDVHLYRKEGDNPAMATVVMGFCKDPTKFQMDSCLRGILTNLIGEATYEAVHVWSNPPSQSGLRVDTINCVHRQPDVRPEHHLVFDGGFWDLQ